MIVNTSGSNLLPETFAIYLNNFFFISCLAVNNCSSVASPNILLSCQKWRLTALVIALIGHLPSTHSHILLATKPCNCDTALAILDILKAATVNEKFSPPNSTALSLDAPEKKPPCNKVSTQWTSLPAATGVWVVNTVFLLTFSKSPSYCLNISNAAGSAWPSFMWTTSKSYPTAWRTLIPATPRTVSCAILILSSPSYNLWEILLAHSLLPSISVVNKYTGQAPNKSASTLYALTFTFSPNVSTSTVTSKSVKKS